MDSSGPFKKTTEGPCDSICSRIGDGTMNRPFSSTLQRYSPANISAISPLRHEGAAGTFADPLLQVRTNESPFFPQFESGDLMVLQIAVERPLGDLQVAAGLVGGHQFALWVFCHATTVEELPYGVRLRVA